MIFLPCIKQGNFPEIKQMTKDNIAATHGEYLKNTYEPWVYEYSKGTLSVNTDELIIVDIDPERFKQFVKYVPAKIDDLIRFAKHEYNSSHDN